MLCWRGRGAAARQELDDRAKFLDALVEKYGVQRPSEPPLAMMPPLPEEDAIRCLQVCASVLCSQELLRPPLERCNQRSGAGRGGAARPPAGRSRAADGPLRYNSEGFKSE